MLLGYYSGAGAFQPAPFGVAGQAGNPREYHFKYFAPYIQDDWKMSSRLTLNAGLRWDYRSDAVRDERPHGLAGHDEPARRHVHRRPEPRHAGDHRRRQFLPLLRPAATRRTRRSGDFAPRLGFAWLPFSDGRTVVRGGYGVFYDSAEGREIDGSADIYPYVSRGSYPQSIGQLTPLQTTDSLFPVFSNPGPVTPAANSFIAVIISENPKDPYVQQWSLGAQRSLTSNTTFELNYVGQQGDEPADAAQHRAGVSLHARSAERAGAEAVSRTSASTSTATGAATPTTTRSMPSSNTGRAAPLVTLAYTWAKSTDSKSAAAGIGASGFNGWQGFLNNHDPQRDHGLSDFDVDHRLVGSFVYNLPFGQGEKFATDATGVKNAVVGGWQVNGIYTWQRGFPITVTAQDLGGVLDTFGTNRANLVGDPNPSGSIRASTNGSTRRRSRSRPSGQFGSVGRNTHARAEHQQPGLRALQEFRAAEEHEDPVPARVVQLLQPPAVQCARHERRLAAVRRDRVGQAGTHQPAWAEVHILSDRYQRPGEGRHGNGRRPSPAARCVGWHSTNVNS